jgi:hypothetical protein
VSESTGLQFRNRAEVVLSDVRKFASDLSGAPDLESARRAWNAILVEFRKFLRFSEQAARKIEKNKWADALIREVDQSKVLNYLFQARNADGHGDYPTTEAAAASLRVGNLLSISGTTYGNSFDLTEVIGRDLTGQPIVRRFQGTISTKDGRITSGPFRSSIPISRTPEHLKLVDFVNRGVTYHRPDMKCPDEEVASCIAHFAANWMDKKFRELCHAFGKPDQP